MTVPSVEHSGHGGWRLEQRKTIYFCAAVLGICMWFLIIYCQIIWNGYTASLAGGPPPFNEFFALWSYAKMANEHSVAALYDMASLHDWQIAHGMRPVAENPFPYPPFVMFLFWPLCWLSYDVGYLGWIIGSLALFIWAVRSTCTRSLVGLLYVVISPASTGNIFIGQSGFLSAALLTAGLRLAATRPVVSGILFGLLSYKPQLGFLVPIALAGAGLWMSFVAAGATVIALASAAFLAFGWGAWRAWIAMLPAYTELFDQAPGFSNMPVVLENLRMLGVPLEIAKLGQALAAIAVAIVLARCFRRNPGRLAAAALMVGVFLASPHAFFYDLPMVTAATVLFIEARLKTSASFTGFEISVLALAALFPITMLLRDFPVPISTISLALLFGIIVREHAARVAAATATSFPDLLLDPVPDRLLDMHPVESRDLL